MIIVVYCHQPRGHMRRASTAVVKYPFRSPKILLRRMRARFVCHTQAAYKHVHTHTHTAENVCMCSTSHPLPIPGKFHPFHTIHPLFHPFRRRAFRGVCARSGSVVRACQRSFECMCVMRLAWLAGLCGGSVIETTYASRRTHEHAYINTNRLQQQQQRL